MCTHTAKTTMRPTMLGMAMPHPVLVCLMLSVLAATSSIATADCPSMCGNVRIPYPFGIGDDCAWRPGFTVTCNRSFTPPRPYVGNVEIMDISLEAGEMRIYSPVVYNCFNSSNTTDSDGSILSFNSSRTPFLVAEERNEFTAIGCGTMGLLQGRDDGGFFTGCLTTCVSLEEAARDGEPCTGLGCCQVPSIPANLSILDLHFDNNVVDNLAWTEAPCSYTFVAEKKWYNFSRQDFSRSGSKSFIIRDGQKRSVPTVLDWAIRSNGSCSSATRVAPACVSAHSHCVNATNGDGYICKCSPGYDGNPYVSGKGGCTNINECDPSIYKDQYPCSGGKCHDLDGGYECRCNFGGRKDSKNDKICRPVLSKLAIVLIAITCAIAILAILFIFLHMKYEKRKLRDSFNKNGGELLKNIGIKIFTKEEMEKITNNYGTILGKGGFGEVYMGTTPNSQQVAVKRSITVDEARKKDFANEVTIQSQISHKNVVRLVGCCLETDIPMLVSEYIPKGSLHDVLHGNGNNSNKVAKHTLSLELRLAIAIESADALAYMHSSASQKILHGDVKSSNILLDDNFMPKVSDFGISRLISMEKHHTNFVVGDINYIDPVYMKTGMLTEKSDVYSFGVVLLELITRKTARYDGNNSLPINFIKSYMTDSKAREMFDEEITSPEVIHCIDMIGKIAVQSLKEDVDERPTMKEVLEQLHLVRNELMRTQGHLSCYQVDDYCMMPTTPEIPPV